MASDILIVDDEADIREHVSGILEDEGYHCRTAANSDGAIRAVEERLPNLVILDIWLRDSERDGLEILKILKKQHPDLPVIMISGHGTIETAVSSIKMGAYDFIEKPFKADRLVLMVRRAIDAARLKRENAELRQRAGADWEMIGEAPNIVQLRNGIDRVAPTDSRVLITGPHGAGKEVVARLIHQWSRRENGQFVVLNCAIMSPERMEIELFGTEHGLDGVGSPRIVGTFEQAHGGTLLLDEVSDMPLQTQGKIVRILHEQTFQRVGGATSVHVDVRVIATSNRDLNEEMEAGRFREDLFYRLNVVPIEVPPLTARREDIPRLVRYFIDRSAEVSGMPRRHVAEDAVAALQSYNWPGNVRQLRNVVDWIMIMASGDVDEPVRSDMLPPEIIATTPESMRWDQGSEIMGLPLREAREIFERQYLVSQIDRFGGNISRTASFVGMERSALHRKLKSLGVGANG
jgi:two-component system, NtrC family, nitrogen regulation response regulator NtrX